MKETPVDTAIHLSLPKFVSNAKGFDLDLAICENLIGGLKKKKSSKCHRHIKQLAASNERPQSALYLINGGEHDV